MTVVEQIFPSLTWRIRHLAMYPDQPYDFVKLENDFDGLHFGLYQNYELTGVVSLFIDENIGQFRKLAILPESQGNGLGNQLMEYLIDFCKLQKLTKLWCNARVNVKSFYERLGFKATEKTFSVHNYDFIIMELDLNQ